MLDDLGLTPALAWLLKEVSRSSGFETHSDIDPAVDTLAGRLPDLRISESFKRLSRMFPAIREREEWRSPSRGGGWVVGTIADDGHGFEQGYSKD